MGIKRLLEEGLITEEDLPYIYGTSSLPSDAEEEPWTPEPRPPGLMERLGGAFQGTLQSFDDPIIDTLQALEAGPRAVQGALQGKPLAGLEAAARQLLPEPEIGEVLDPFGVWRRTAAAGAGFLDPRGQEQGSSALGAILRGLMQREPGEVAPSSAAELQRLATREEEVEAATGVSRARAVGALENAYGEVYGEAGELLTEMVADPTNWIAPGVGVGIKRAVQPAVLAAAKQAAKVAPKGAASFITQAIARAEVEAAARKAALDAAGGAATTAGQRLRSVTARTPNERLQALTAGEPVVFFEAKVPEAKLGEALGQDWRSRYRVGTFNGPAFGRRMTAVWHEGALRSELAGTGLRPKNALSRLVGGDEKLLARLQGGRWTRPAIAPGPEIQIDLLGAPAAREGAPVAAQAAPDLGPTSLERGARIVRDFGALAGEVATLARKGGPRGRLEVLNDLSRRMNELWPTTPAEALDNLPRLTATAAELRLVAERHALGGGKSARGRIERLISGLEREHDEIVASAVGRAVAPPPEGDPIVRGMRAYGERLRLLDDDLGATAGLDAAGTQALRDVRRKLTLARDQATANVETMMARPALLTEPTPEVFSALRQHEADLGQLRGQLRGHRDAGEIGRKTFQRYASAIDRAENEARRQRLRLEARTVLARIARRREAQASPTPQRVAQAVVEPPDPIQQGLFSPEAEVRATGVDIDALASELDITPIPNLEKTIAEALAVIPESEIEAIARSVGRRPGPGAGPTRTAAELRAVESATAAAAPGRRPVGPLREEPVRLPRCRPQDDSWNARARGAAQEEAVARAVDERRNAAAWRLVEWARENRIPTGQLALDGTMPELEGIIGRFAPGISAQARRQIGVEVGKRLGPEEIAAGYMGRARAALGEKATEPAVAQLAENIRLAADGPGNPNATIAAQVARDPVEAAAPGMAKFTEPSSPARALVAAADEGGFRLAEPAAPPPAPPAALPPGAAAAPEPTWTHMSDSQALGKFASFMATKGDALSAKVGTAILNLIVNPWRDIGYSLGRYGRELAMGIMRGDTLRQLHLKQFIKERYEDVLLKALPRKQDRIYAAAIADGRESLVAVPCQVLDDFQAGKLPAYEKFIAEWKTTMDEMRKLLGLPADKGFEWYFARIGDPEAASQAFKSEVAALREQLQKGLVSKADFNAARTAAKERWLIGKESDAPESLGAFDAIELAKATADPYFANLMKRSGPFDPLKHSQDPDLVFSTYVHRALRYKMAKDLLPLYQKARASLGPAERGILQGLWGQTFRPGQTVERQTVRYLAAGLGFSGKKLEQAIPLVGGLLRSLSFAKYLGFNLASAGVNLTQTVFNTLPRFGLDWTMRGLKAMRRPEVRAGLARSGRLSAARFGALEEWSPELTGQLAGSLRRAEQTFMDVAGYLFNKPEDFNVGLSYATGWERAAAAVDDFKKTGQIADKELRDGLISMSDREVAMEMKSLRNIAAKQRLAQRMGEKPARELTPDQLAILDSKELTEAQKADRLFDRYERIRTALAGGPEAEARFIEDVAFDAMADTQHLYLQSNRPAVIQRSDFLRTFSQFSDFTRNQAAFILKSLPNREGAVPKYMAMMLAAGGPEALPFLSDAILAVFGEDERQRLAKTYDDALGVPKSIDQAIGFDVGRRIGSNLLWGQQFLESKDSFLARAAPFKALSEMAAALTAAWAAGKDAHAERMPKSRDEAIERYKLAAEGRGLLMRPAEGSAAAEVAKLLGVERLPGPVAAKALPAGSAMASAFLREGAGAPGFMPGAQPKGETVAPGLLDPKIVQGLAMTTGFSQARGGDFSVLEDLFPKASALGGGGDPLRRAAAKRAAALVSQEGATPEEAAEHVSRTSGIPLGREEVADAIVSMGRPALERALAGIPRSMKEKLELDDARRLEDGLGRRYKGFLDAGDHQSAEATYEQILDLRTARLEGLQKQYELEGTEPPASFVAYAAILRDMDARFSKYVRNYWIDPQGRRRPLSYVKEIEQKLLEGDENLIAWLKGIRRDEAPAVQSLGAARLRESGPNPGS